MTLPVTGSGSSADPWKITATYTGGAHSMKVEWKYINGDDWFYVTLTPTLAAGNTQAVKIYHTIDTYLNGGDAGPAFTYPDSGLGVKGPLQSGFQSNFANGQFTTVGVSRYSGSPGAYVLAAPYEVFIKGNRTFDRYGSYFYQDIINAPAAGADLPNTINRRVDTDNGIGVQFNLGAVSGVQPAISYRLSFSNIIPPDPPVLTSYSAASTVALSVPENTLGAVATAAGTGTGISYAITGGADAEDFVINPTTGALSFISPPDFESPADTSANGSNTYNVIVSVLNGGGAVEQTFNITVTDVNPELGPGCVAAGLKVWLRADASAFSDAGSTPATDGQSVAQWNNQAPGSTYHVAQTTAAYRPTLYTSDTAKLLNFNPAIDWDGSTKYLQNTTPLMASDRPYTYLVVSSDEDTGTGFRKVLSTESAFDYLGLYKQGGATGNNGWVPYAVGGVGDYGDMGKGTKYAPPGGAAGFWNGTNFTKDASVESIQPQIVGYASLSSSPSDPFHTFVDGFKDTPSWRPLQDGTFYRQYHHQSLTIGADGNSSGAGVENWKGRIAEVIGFDGVISDSNRQKIETYLAIKYGVTLGQGNGAVGHNGNNVNYVSASGATIWSASANSGYGHDIAGIGRENCTSLYQKQSASVNADNIVTIGLGTAPAATNAANTGTLGDGQYEMWGNNNASVSFSATYAPHTFTPVGTYVRMGRVWKVSETGGIGNVFVSVPASVGAAHLLVDGTSAFGGTTREIAMTSDGNGNLVAIANFANGEFFSFGRDVKSPGCVATSTFPCNLVQNGDFAGSAGWTISAGWAITGGHAENYTNSVSNQSLSQTVSGLSTAVNSGNLTFSLNVTGGEGNGTTGNSASLVIKLGATTIATLQNPTTASNITVSTGVGVTASLASFPRATATTITFTVPWSAATNSALLEFLHTATLDDWIVDNVTITGACPVSLAAWYKADAITATADAAALATWMDSSVTGFDVSQATAAWRPTYYKTTTGKLVNFNPAVDFNDGHALWNLARLYPATSGYTLIGVGVRRATNMNSADGIMGIGNDGNYPAMDFQGDGLSTVNGFNPWMTGSSPAEWGGTTAGTYSIAPVPTLNSPLITALTSSNASTTATDNILSWLNGYKETTTLDSQQQAQIGNGVYVGSSYDFQFIGQVPEVIVYNGPLTDADMRKINTYLAIKYGVTLGHNYLDASGANIFASDGTSNAQLYDNRVTGIGREDCEDLHQKQSKSQAPGAIISIAHKGFAADGTNAGNTNALDNMEYFITGDNNGSVNAVAVPGTYAGSIASAGLTHVTLRKWKAVETGNAGKICIRVPKASFPGIYGDSLHLIVTPQTGPDTFTTLAVPPIAPIVTTGVYVEFEYDFPADSDPSQPVYFSFAGIAPPSPACLTGIKLWTKADEGVTDDGTGEVTEWLDTSSGIALSQDTAANRPDVVTNWLNFNPAINFDGNDVVGNPSAGPSVFPASTDPATIITVSSMTNNTGAWKTLVSYGGALDQPSTHWYGDQLDIYTDPGGDRLNTAHFAINTPVISYFRIPNASTTNGASIGYNGLSNNQTFSSFAYTPAANGLVTVGGETDSGNEGLYGQIAETITFNRMLSDAELKQVMSYLAIKYGIALDHNLVSPTNVTLYTPTGTPSGSFGMNIVAIGREDCEGLHQKQSKTGRLTLGIDGQIANSNPEHTGGIAVDHSYLVAGENGLTGTTVMTPG